MNESIDRAELLKVVAMVKPALATQDYIPALRCVKFHDGRVTAFNDIAALSVDADFNIERCVPGDLLMKTLSSFSGANVAAQFDKKTNALLLSSGRSKIKLPTLGVAEHTFEFPSLDEVVPEVLLTDDMINGIERCLLSAGKDATHPAQMGVTLETLDGNAVLYSTDNETISRYTTKEKIELPGDTPVILPTFFCEQVVAMRKAFPATKQVWLMLLPGALLVEFDDKASVFHKTVLDLEPMNFSRIFKKFYGGGESPAVTVPDSLDAAFGRSLMVLSNEATKTTTIKANARGFELHTSSDAGDADDEVQFKEGGHVTFDSFKIDPALMVRGLKQTTTIAFLPTVVALSDKKSGFTHLIAHVAA